MESQEEMTEGKTSYAKDVIHNTGAVSICSYFMLTVLMCKEIPTNSTVLRCSVYPGCTVVVSNAK
jgi:hypothetical protein